MHRHKLHNAARRHRIDSWYDSKKQEQLVQMRDLQRPYLDIVDPSRLTNSRLIRLDESTRQEEDRDFQVSYRECHTPDQPLEPNHTHFLLVDNGREGQDALYSEIEFRCELEKFCCEQFGVPCVQIVIQGGVGTFRTAAEALNQDCQVVFVRDSGGCAYIVSEVLSDLLGKSLADLPLEAGVRRAEVKARIHSSDAFREYLMGLGGDLQKDLTKRLTDICMHLESIHLFSFRELLHREANEVFSEGIATVNACLHFSPAHASF